MLIFIDLLTKACLVYQPVSLYAIFILRSSRYLRQRFAQRFQLLLRYKGLMFIIIRHFSFIYIISAFLYIYTADKLTCFAYGSQDTGLLSRERLSLIRYGDY